MLVIENYSAIISYAVLEKNLASKKITSIVKKLNQIESELMDTHLFLLDAEAVAGIKHLQACMYFGIKAFQQETNTAKSLTAEIMLYLSGNRQISKAIQKVGLTLKSKNILLIQLVKNDETTIQSYKNSLFHFTDFLQEENIVVSKYTFDALDFKPKQYIKLKKNLKITEKSIDLFISQDNFEYTYEKVVEKLAIEKSALLNLNK